SIPVPLRSAGSADRPLNGSAWSWLPSLTLQPPPLPAAGTTPAFRKSQAAATGSEEAPIAGVPPPAPGLRLSATIATTRPTTRTAPATAAMSNRLPRPWLFAVRTCGGGAGAYSRWTREGGRAVGSPIVAAITGRIAERLAPGSREWFQFGPQRRPA